MKNLKKVKETDYPTAGRYDPQNGIFDKNIKCNDDYGSPFLTTAARFSDQHDMSRRNSHLGPNTYELENMSLAEKSMLEAKNKQTLKGKGWRYRAIEKNDFRCLRNKVCSKVEVD